MSKKPPSYICLCLTHTITFFANENVEVRLILLQMEDHFHPFSKTVVKKRKKKKRGGSKFLKGHYEFVCRGKMRIVFYNGIFINTNKYLIIILLL